MAGASSQSINRIIAPCAADNKSLLAIGGVVVVAAVAAVASGNSGQVEVAGGVGAPAVATGASDVPATVAEARAWIAAYKKRSNK